MTTKRLNIAIIGLGFGAEFIPIYQKYPHANLYAVCQRNREKAEAIADFSFDDLQVVFLLLPPLLISSSL